MRWVVIAVAALLVGLLAYGVSAQGTDTTLASALSNGRHPQAPDARLPKLGEAASGRLADYRGQVVLVNFWASWCPPCTAELPLLERLQGQMRAKGATVVGINTRDASEDAQAFVDKYALTFPSLRDGSGEFGERWGVIAYPESFLLDKQGRVVAATQGTVDQAWIDEHVLPLVEEG